MHNKNQIYPSIVSFREVLQSDLPILAQACATEAMSSEFWINLIQGYMNNEFNPHHALSKRVIFVAAHAGTPIGFIAGHLTSRSDYPGHIQWISVARTFQRKGIGSELLWILAAWFADQDINRVRSDVSVEQIGTRSFYTHHKAELQNSHWLCWEDVRTIRLKES